MNDEINFQLRASWRESDVPNAEQASQLFEKHSRGAHEDQSLIDQAMGILMSAYGIDSETAGQLLTRLALSSRLRVSDVAGGVVEATTRPAEYMDERAAEVASRLLSGAASLREDPATTGTAESIDLRPSPTPRLSGTG
jgi:hypothetical protein